MKKIKIALASDNHGSLSVLQHIASAIYDADYYLHCGDSALKSEQIKPFISVKGNVDYADYPLERSINIANYKFLLLHGHKYLNMGFENLYHYAKENEYDVVLFGHIHSFKDFEYEGIRFINPGSCLNNRDGTKASYALIEIDEEGIKVERRDIDV